MNTLKELNCVSNPIDSIPPSMFSFKQIQRLIIQTKNELDVSKMKKNPRKERYSFLQDGSFRYSFLLFHGIIK